MTTVDIFSAPGHEVLVAFGASGAPKRLAGGRGVTWRAGEVVLRPAGDPVESMWKSKVLSELDVSDEFTFPRPIQDDRGQWVRDGWEAMEFISGAADETRVEDIVHAGTAFHQAISGLPRPSFIAASNDPWSQADRIAWGEGPMPKERLLNLAAAEYGAIEGVEQVIHGDLLGNVLFAEGHPPALIDWAPYWRPAGFGAAIAVVDAVCWHRYPIQRLGHHHGTTHWRQLLLRALVFRMVTLHHLGRWDQNQYERHAPIMAAVIALPSR